MSGATAGEWWREKGNKRVHLVKHRCGSKGLIVEAVCGRYIGPHYKDVKAGRGKRTYCPGCRP